MKYHTLGPTGLLVSEICLGTMTFALGEGMWKSISGVEQNLADQLLKRSFDAGVAGVSYTPGTFPGSRSIDTNPKRPLTCAVAKEGKQ